MKGILSILVILSILCACQESEKDKIARLVKEWEGKEILFPDYSIFTIQGKDTTDFSFINSDYKVVTIGNPVHIPKVRELYLRLLTGDKTQKAETPVTEVRMDMESIAFGSFPQAEKQERKFMLANTGNHMLVVYDVVTSCGCTKVEYSKEGIRPGKKGRADGDL